MNARTIKQKDAFEHFGPLEVGGTYYSGYWRQAYTVLGFRLVSGVPLVRRLWAAGHETEHSTAWDRKRDKVLSAPDGRKPLPGYFARNYPCAQVLL